MAGQIGVGRRHDFCPLGHVGINDEEGEGGPRRDRVSALVSGDRRRVLCCQRGVRVKEGGRRKIVLPPSSSSLYTPPRKARGLRGNFGDAFPPVSLSLSLSRLIPLLLNLHFANLRPRDLLK